MSFNRQYVKPERVHKTASMHPDVVFRLPVRITLGSVPSQPKRQPAKRAEPGPRIRESAKGEQCDVRLEGVCNFNPETTVWSHCPLNEAGHGMAIKSLDCAGTYCCSACHDVVDGRAPRPAGMTQESVLLSWFLGHMRSLVKLNQKGLL